MTMQRTKDPTIRFTFVIGFLLLALLIFLLGCDQSAKGDLVVSGHSVTMTSMVGSYRFEYSGDYDIVDPGVSDNWLHTYSSLTLLAPKDYMPGIIPNPSKGTVETQQLKYSPSVIDIFVLDGAEDNSTAKTRLDSKLNWLAKSDDFVLLDRSPVVVSGIEGEQVTYMDKKMLLSPVIDWVREVYFDYDGLVWIITTSCDEDKQQDFRPDFASVLSSFTVLEQ